MAASTRKQLNIRSDEAYATAHDLAEQIRTTTIEVVVRALREFQSKRRILSRLVSLEEAEANLSALMESVRGRGQSSSGSLSSDHDYLYYESGLPK
jgi:hypothetical protein